jgi:hypothetical protein
MDDIRRVEGIEAAARRVEAIAVEAERTLAAQSRAAGDDTHYFKASLQHYTDWLVLNGGVSADRDTVGAYLDAMNGRSWPRLWLKTRKILHAVRRDHP